MISTNSYTRSGLPYSPAGSAPIQDPGLLGKAGGLLGKVGGPLAAVSSAYGASRALMDETSTGWEKAGNATGQLAGAVTLVSPIAGALLAAIGAGTSALKTKRIKKEGRRRERVARGQTEAANLTDAITIRDAAEASIAGQRQALSRGGATGGANVTGLGTVVADVNNAMAQALLNSRIQREQLLNQRLADINAGVMQERASADALMEKSMAVMYKSIESAAARKDLERRGLLPPRSPKAPKAPKAQAVKAGVPAATVTIPAADQRYPNSPVVATNMDEILYEPYIGPYIGSRR